MSAQHFVKMHIHKLALDPHTRSPIVILQDDKTGWLLPIWVGIFEAHAIAIKLEGIESTRPMTHDLLCNLIESMNGKIEKIAVTDLIDSTYFAAIHYHVGEQQHHMDARPSDAIALALRSASPIYVAVHVLDRSKLDPALLKSVSNEEDAFENLEAENQEQWNTLFEKMNTPPDPDKLN